MESGCHMKKLIACVLLSTIVILAASFAVVQTESSQRISTIAFDNVAIRLSSRYTQFRYVSMHSAGLSGEVRVYERHSLGWPLKALRTDSCRQDGSWYAHLDLCRLGVNFTVASIVSSVIVIGLSVLRRSRQKRITLATQPVQAPPGRPLWGVAFGTFLIGVPLFSWWAYCYAYEDQFLFKEHRWLSDFGRHLRLVGLLGLLVYGATWLMLVRYCRRGMPKRLSREQACPRC